MKYFKILTAGLTLFLPLLAGAPAAAQTEEQPAAGAAADGAEGAALLVELNKAEQIDRGCQYFLLLRNGTDYAFEVFRLDLYFFDTDGVISKRLLIDTPAMQQGDTKVAGFIASDLQCDSVSQILVNDVEPCEVAGDAAPESCTALLALNNRTDIKFFK
jgi:hypothetical protein